VRAFLGVCRDLVIGDDPVTALALAAGLGGCAALAAVGVPAWWLLPAVVVVATLLSLRRAVARGG
jgi:hypothetical protein